MKICLVAPVSGWRGGMHQYSVHLADSLEKRATVEALGYKSIFPLWLYPGESKRLSGEIPLGNNIPVYEILKYYSPLSSVKAAKVIESKIRPDVVHIEWIAPQLGFILIPLIYLLKQRTHAKIVLNVHNVLPHEPRLFDGVLSTWAFKLSHRLVVHATNMKEELIRSFNEDDNKIKVIPHGVCASAEKKYTPIEARTRLGIKEKRVVLFFGFVRPYKGLDYLISALTRIVTQFDVALVIAGEFFSDVDKCLREIQRQGVAKKTYLFPRYIPYEEVPLFFSAADIVVQPYLRFSGQSGVTQTAYLYSIPVVSTNVGGLPELVRDGKTGFVVKPADPQALGTALAALLTDENMRREFGINGRKFLESDMSWDNIAQCLMEIYAEA